MGDTILLSLLFEHVTGNRQDLTVTTTTCTGTITQTFVIRASSINKTLFKQLKRCKYVKIILLSMMRIGTFGGNWCFLKIFHKTEWVV